MATITHVTAGEVALAAHQNGLIDQVNTNTGGISDLDGRVTTLETATEPFVPRCVLRKSADQSIPNDADTVVTWDVAESNNNGMHQGNTVVIPQFGEYLVAAAVNIAPGGTVPDDCVLYVSLNDPDMLQFIGDTAVGGFGQPSVNDGGLGNGLSLSVLRQFNAGDVLTVVVYQKSGAARNARYTAFGGCTFGVTQQTERN